MSKELVSGVALIGPAIDAGLRHCQGGMSEFASARVGVEGSRVSIVPVFEVPKLLEDPDRTVVGVYVGFNGSVSGHGLLIFEEPSARWLLGQLVGSIPATSVWDDPLSRSALMEMGNVTVSGFLNGLADWFHMAILPEAPVIACDIMGAILNSITATVSMAAEQAVAVSTRFEFADSMGVHGYLLLLLDNDSLDKMMSSSLEGMVQ